MKNRTLAILFLFVSLAFCTACFAEAVILKSGQKINGSILSKTDKYIKIDFQGVPITYYADEIATIDGQPAASFLKNDKDLQGGSTSENTDKNKIVEEILKLSGFKKQIESYPSVVQLKLAEYKNKMKPEVFSLFNQAMLQSFNAETMYRVVFDSLIVNFDSKHYAAFLNWLHSPLSIKMSQLEEKASNAEAYQDMMGFAAKLKSNPPAQERVLLAQELDKAVGATYLNIEAAALMNLQMIKALETVVPQEKRIGEENWEEKFKSALRTKLQQPIQQETLISFLYTYRSVSDKELKEYINFWDSQEGHWCNKTLSDAFLDAIAKSGREIGNRLAKTLPKKPQVVK